MLKCTTGKTNIKLLLEAAELKPDFGKADTEAKLLYQYAKTVDSLLTVAEFYYEKKAYEEDQFEKGKALRAQMESAMKAYTEHYSNFAAAMDVLSKDLTERELKKFKDDNRMGHYYMLSNINCAEAMFEYIDNNAEDNFSGVSIEELDKFLTDFNKSLTELEQLSMDEEKFKKEFGIKTMRISSFIKGSSDLFVAVKEFKKRIETKNWKFKITHPNIPDEGSYEKISKTYESLIQSYNSAI